MTRTTVANPIPLPETSSVGVESREGLDQFPG